MSRRFWNSDKQVASISRYLCPANFSLRIADLGAGLAVSHNSHLTRMLPFKEYGNGDLALVLMPFLGGSQREWYETVDLLKTSYRCITVDLPGFGAGARVPGYSVREMCDSLIECLTVLKIRQYYLVGHSMAGKVSLVTARRLFSEGLPVPPPSGLVLVAPSPPSPEPMTDSKRKEMLDSLGSRSQLQEGRYSDRDRSAAEKFVRDNIAQPIVANVFERTVDDVLIMNPEAWVAWLQSGSNENWASFVGTLDLPALVIAGTHDKALGPEAQQAKTLIHLTNAKLEELQCSHLIPLERPKELASLMRDFLEDGD